MGLLQLDYNLFQHINGLAGTASGWNPVMRFLAEEGEYLFILGVIVYWFTRAAGNRRMVAQALLSACAALSVSGVIGDFAYRNRPFVAHHVLQLIPHAANASFPSDHATGAFVIAASIWLYRKRDGWLWLAGAGLIGLSRIWCGVHYPVDVLAGACLGVISALAVHKLLHWLPANRLINSLIELYEKMERKLWA